MNNESVGKKIVEALKKQAESIDIAEENNCKIIYFKKIYNKGQIRKLPKEKYKSFIREFINEGKR